MKKQLLYTLILLFSAMLTFAQSNVKYEYDEIYRLTRVRYSNGTVVEYTYDALGNRTAKEVTGGSAPIVENAEPYAVLSNNNTLLTFYYDDQMEARGGMEANIYPWISRAGEIKTVVFDASFNQCKTINNTSYWFKNCENLTNIIGLSYLHTEAVNNMEWMFYNCSGLTSLDVSHFDTRNVTNMFGMFEGCTNLTGLDVSHFNTEKVTNMQQMFSCCYSLKDLDLTHFDTRKVTNMRHMLSFCKSLEELDLRSFETGKVTDMGCMFRSSSKLKTITVAEDWDMSQVADSEDMFDMCYSLVGGSGTTYDSSHTDNTYARIDGGTDSPGYFTFKEKTGVQGVSLDNKRELKCIYDLQGRKIPELQKGLNIIRMNDATTKKVVIK